MDGPGLAGEQSPLDPGPIRSIFAMEPDIFEDFDASGDEHDEGDWGPLMALADQAAEVLAASPGDSEQSGDESDEPGEFSKKRLVKALENLEHDHVGNRALQEDCCENRCWADKACLARIQLFRRANLALSRTERERNLRHALLLCRKLQRAEESSRGGSPLVPSRAWGLRVASDMPVCLSAFTYAYGYAPRKCSRGFRDPISRAKMLADTPEALLPRPHGLTGRTGNAALPGEDTELVINFMLNIAKIHALPQPSERGAGVQELPAIMTLRRLFHDYKDEADKEDSTMFNDPEEERDPTVPPRGRIPLAHQVSESSFRRIVKGHPRLSHIRIRSKKTDYCNVCHRYRRGLLQLRSLGLPANDPAVMQLGRHLDEHLRDAETLRERYRRLRREAQAEEAKAEDGRELGVISMDFAQALLIPRFASQPGGLFYLKPLKLHMFGVCDEGSHLSSVYLTREEVMDAVSKSTDAVMTFCHHALERLRVKGRRRAVIHADNAAAQNKSKHWIRYGIYLIATGRFDSVEIYYMLAGHTKFEPDSLFGRCKRHLWEADSMTPADVKRVLDELDDVEVLLDNEVLFYPWRELLANLGKPIPDMRFVQGLRFTRRPGAAAEIVVEVQYGAAEEWEDITQVVLGPDQAETLALGLPGELPVPIDVLALEPSEKRLRELAGVAEYVDSRKLQMEYDPYLSGPWPKVPKANERNPATEYGGIAVRKPKVQKRNRREASRGRQRRARGGGAGRGRSRRRASKIEEEEEEEGEFTEHSEGPESPCNDEDDVWFESLA